ncbi:MAG: TolC family protein [Bacteroidetes bacterium]|nr:TolC family protein [Bacteroidota bacterium]
MRGATKHLIFVITLLFTAMFSDVCAQEPLSVLEAVQVGLKNNFDAQIQSLEVEQAKRLNEWGQAGALPSINLSANQNNSVIERKPANPFAVAGRNISNTIPGNLDIQWTLFNGFAIRLNKSRLDQLEQQSAGNARVVLESTVQTIVLGYYNVLLEQQRLEVRKKAVQFSKQLYDYVRLKKDLGGAITFDVLQQQNNFLTDSANVLRQELAFKSAKRNLNELLNEPLDKDYMFLDDFAFTPVETRYDYETLRGKMLSSNANLRNQFIIQELQRIARQSLQSSMYPSLSLNLGSTGSLDQLNARFRPTENGTVVKNTIGYLNDDDAQPVISRSFAPEYRTLQGYSYGGFANLTLRFNLFNGGQVRRAVKNAEIEQRIIQLGTDKLKLSLENDLLTFLEQYQLRRQLATIANTKLRAAELNLNLAYERYRNGSFSAIDLRIIEENFQNAALENYAAIFDVLSVKTDLVRLTGGLLDEYR